MHRYRVVFGDRDPAAFGAEEFDAPTMADALFHIASFHSRQPVELWQDGQFLGRLEHVANKDGSFWQVAASER